MEGGGQGEKGGEGGWQQDYRPTIQAGIIIYYFKSKKYILRRRLRKAILYHIDLKGVKNFAAKLWFFR